MSRAEIDHNRLLDRIHALGGIGRDEAGSLTRLAASDADKAARDQLVSWLQAANLDVVIDRIGNIFGVWAPDTCRETGPVMLGSHIDTVINAGIYDGCYGVLAGLEVIETLQASGFAPERPLVVAAFTNEEGVRYAPDMMGSLVYAGGLGVEDALRSIGTDGTVLGDELRRIGYAGAAEPGVLRPFAYLELHVEQGPVLEREGFPVGAVANLQGISWQQVTITGAANHAGATPMALRQDAGHAAARVITYLRERARNASTPTVATVGRISFEPNAINVIPSRAVLTIDLRDPDETRLQAEENALAVFFTQLAAEEQVEIEVERLARFSPVTFDARLVALIEATAAARGLACRRMTSGAGHDAQMMARIAPTAMVFVPSHGGISHNPLEFTPNDELVMGATILLDVVRQLSTDGAVL